MAKLTPDEFAAKWSANLAGSTDAIRRGVERVSESPGPKAARQKNLYVQRVQARADHWAARLNALSLPDWQRDMTEKGIPRVAGGAAAAQGKMASFASQLLPHIEAGLPRIHAMPKGTIADSKARANAWIDHMAQFRRRGAAGQ